MSTDSLFPPATVLSRCPAALLSKQHNVSVVHLTLLYPLHSGSQFFFPLQLFWSRALATPLLWTVGTREPSPWQPLPC